MMTKNKEPFDAGKFFRECIKENKKEIKEINKQKRIEGINQIRSKKVRCDYCTKLFWYGSLKNIGSRFNYVLVCRSCANG